MADLAAPVSDGAPAEALVDSLTAMIEHPDYPCLGAKSVLHQRRVTPKVYGTLGTDEAADALAADLRGFVADTPPKDGFTSFLAVFRGPEIVDEVHFERLLWRQLALLSARDEADWNLEVSADPADDHFAFSLHGAAFFVVGLHPRASRDARRAGTPVLVFNRHEQFERLRAAGQYARMRDLIRRRDERLQGSINPMVGDHGSLSEARQYAGRCVHEQWQPPALDQWPA